MTSTRPSGFIVMLLDCVSTAASVFSGSKCLAARRQSIYLLAKKAGTPASDAAPQVRSYERHWTPIHLDFVVEEFESAIEKALQAGARLEKSVATQEWGKLAPCQSRLGTGSVLYSFLVVATMKLPTRQGNISIDA